MQESSGPDRPRGLVGLTVFIAKGVVIDGLYQSAVNRVLCRTMAGDPAAEFLIVHRSKSGKRHVVGNNSAHRSSTQINRHVQAAQVIGPVGGNHSDGGPGLCLKMHFTGQCDQSCFVGVADGRRIIRQRCCQRMQPMVQGWMQSARADTSADLGLMRRRQHLYRVHMSACARVRAGLLDQRFYISHHGLEHLQRSKARTA